MDIKPNLIETLIIYLIVDVIILRLLFASFLKRQKAKGKGSRFLWSELGFLGGLLSSFGIFLLTPPNFNQGWQLNPAMFAGAAPIVCIGVPSLILGIFLVNNP